MKKFINNEFQAFANLIVGLAIYFGLQAFFPDCSDAIIVTISMAVMGHFAEWMEMKVK